jgi:hypothetical protein
MKKILLISLVFFGKIVAAQNVGIGTLTPTSKLNVNGQVTIDQKNFGGYGGLLIKGGTAAANYPNITFSILNNSIPQTDVIAGYFGGHINSDATGSEAMDLVFQTSLNGFTGLTEKFRIKDNGNVGIGTTNPAYKLHLGYSNTGIRIEGPAAAATGGTALSIGEYGDVVIDKPGIPAGRIAIKENGDVGIGTATPYAYGHGGTNRILEVKNFAPAGINIQSHLILSSTTTSGSLGGVTWASTSLAGQQMTSFIGSVFETANQAKLTFYTRNNAGILAEKFTIGGSGNVGIGETNPGFPLNFTSTLGDKISLFGNAGNHYGFGIASNTLQIHAATATDDIAFGTGSSGSFNERFRFKGNGAFVVNSNAGSTGQVLKSGGAGAPPSWANSDNIQQINDFSYYQSISDITTFQENSYNLSNMSKSITVTSPSLIVITFNATAINNYCFGCPSAKGEVQLKIDGVAHAVVTHDIENIAGSDLVKGRESFSCSFTYKAATAGTYGFTVLAKNRNGNSAGTLTWLSANSSCTYQIISL